MAKNDSRSKLLAEFGIDESDITPTQEVLIMLRMDYEGQYKKERDGAKKREIGTHLMRIIKMLDSRKSKKGKPKEDYKAKYRK